MLIFSSVLKPNLVLKKHMTKGENKKFFGKNTVFGSKSSSCPVYELDESPLWLQFSPACIGNCLSQMHNDHPESLKSINYRNNFNCYFPQSPMQLQTRYLFCREGTHRDDSNSRIRVQDVLDVLMDSEQILKIFSKSCLL